MSAGKLKLVIEQGTDFSCPLFWKTGDPLVAVNLTGYTAKMQAKATYKATTKLLDLTTTNGGLVITGSTGKVEIVLTAAQTAALTWTDAVYDLILISPAGKKKRLVSGSIAVSQGVTE